MKRIVNGKIYNTETAELIAEYERDDRSSFSWCRESLYKTTRGRFFVAGEGHANSRWAENCGNTRGPGSGIIVLSESEALEWCEERNIDADTVEEHFEIDFG